MGNKARETGVYLQTVQKYIFMNFVAEQICITVCYCILCVAQDTFRAEGDSLYLDTLSGFTVSVKAGHGEEWLNFFVLRKSSFPHLEHT